MIALLLDGAEEKSVTAQHSILWGTGQPVKLCQFRDGVLWNLCATCRLPGCGNAALPYQNIDHSWRAEYCYSATIDVNGVSFL